jgi:hypothetical protein
MAHPVHLFTINKEVHGHGTRNFNNLHPLLVNLSEYKKCPYMMCVKVYNHLPQIVKNATDKPVLFKSLLRRFLYHHSFYAMEEYFECRDNL